MNKVKIKGVEHNLIGESIAIDAKLHFHAKDNKDDIFDIASIKGYKIISVFPDINTSVCDLQTKKISELAQKYPEIHFISISNDPIGIINKWCMINAVNNLMILSDRELSEFASATNLLIEKINKLARAFLFIDEKNRVVDIAMHEEVSMMPDFEKIEDWIVKIQND